jgi:hypothetical protein
MKTRSQTRNEKIIVKSHSKHVSKAVVFEKMRTRFQARNEALAVAEENPKSPVEHFFVLPCEPMIDFDDASACWRANKKYLGNGMFKYIRKPMVPSVVKLGDNSLIKVAEHIFTVGIDRQ